MKGSNSKQQLLHEVKGKHSITSKDIRGKQPDYTYYLRKQTHQITSFFYNSFSRTPSEKICKIEKDIKHQHSVACQKPQKNNTYIQNYFSNSLTQLRNYLVSLYPKNRYQFNHYVWPILNSGIGLILGELASGYLSRTCFKNTDYDFIFKFLFGSAMLSFSAMQRITDKRIQSPTEFAISAASELVGIFYLYTSSFRLTQHVVGEYLPSKYALIASLGVSTLGVPGTAASLAKTYQQYAVKHQYSNGAQRSDTALINAGRTPVANIYLQVNAALVKAMMPASSLYQGALIIDNILTAKNAVNQAKNVPALVFGDLAPQIYSRITDQQSCIEKDFHYNTAKQTVLRFNHGIPQFISLERYKLQTGDLVYCDEKFNASSSAISGDVVALNRDEKNNFIPEYKALSYRICLVANNGEGAWIERKTAEKLDELHHLVDLKAIREGKQNAILKGTGIDFKNQNDFFIRVKEEKERILENGYEKTSEINQIITQHKTNMVKRAIYSSMLFSLLISRDLYNFPLNTLKWMFNLFQTFIPFAESFLRSRVNKTLLERLNRNLPDKEMMIIDALRVVDFLNAISGYYQDRFPKGVIIVSDKTGTLTDSTMVVRGCCTPDMSSNVQQLLKQSNSPLLPNEKHQYDAFDKFTKAFTGQPKELEPEEVAIREFFQTISPEYEFKIESIANQHYRKMFRNSDQVLETRHLGLFTRLGGRFTLVTENAKKQLVFCGIPRGDEFANTSLFMSYQTMVPRRNILSRDWCIASCDLADDEFNDLLHLFERNDPKLIETYLCSKPTILQRLSHCCTFLIDNPTKKAANQFISNCREADVSVIVATGDSAKASENIARVLCPTYTQQIVIIRTSSTTFPQANTITPLSTVIFAGLNDAILQIFSQLMSTPIDLRPVIIFSEMSTEGKGILVDYLNKAGYFVAANGDNTNDKDMMRRARVVFSHRDKNGNYNPGVEQFSNLDDVQLQALCQSDQSFYELFDIHRPRGNLFRLFGPLLNSQEKATTSLTLKNVVMSFDLAKALGFPNVIEMPNQHWAGLGFNLLWFLTTILTIDNTADMPADDKHLLQSDKQKHYLLTAVAIATLESLITYAVTGETTNLTCMFLMLSFLPLILKSIFSAFGNFYEEANAPVIEEVQNIPTPIQNDLRLFQSSNARITEAKQASELKQLQLTRI